MSSTAPDPGQLECPTPDKRQYRSQAAAKRHQRRRYAAPGEHKPRCYPYECECGEHWHLTRQTPAQQRAVAERMAAKAARAEQKRRTA